MRKKEREKERKQNQKDERRGKEIERRQMDDRKGSAKRKERRGGGRVGDVRGTGKGKGFDMKREKDE